MTHQERYIPGVDAQDDQTTATREEWFRRQPIAGYVMDLGCGVGYLTKVFAEMPKVTGVLALDDFEGERIEHSKVEHWKVDILEEAKHWTQTIISVDTVTAGEFIEHIPYYDLLKLLKAIHKVLRPGGYFIGTTPNGHYDPTFLRRCSHPFHIREYHETELKYLLDQFFPNVVVEHIGCGTNGFVCQK